MDTSIIDSRSTEKSQFIGHQEGQYLHFTVRYIYSRNEVIVCKEIHRNLFLLSHKKDLCHVNVSRGKDKIDCQNTRSIALITQIRRS